MLYLYMQALSAAGCLSLRRPLRRSQSGQASAEYALVLLGAAAIALLVAAWAAKSGLIGQLLDTVLGKITSDAGGRRSAPAMPRP